jgi:hypothetical protein
MEVMLEPSLRKVKQKVLDLGGSGGVGVIGSTTEIALFRNLSTEEYYRSGMLRLIEAGFPSDNHHQVMMLPTFGYAGVAAWAQRIIETATRPEKAFGESEP